MSNASASNRSERRPWFLRAGERVEVRSLNEIGATLDGDGCLEALPFMAEMQGYAGSEQRVQKRVDKIIDLVELSGLRRMTRAVTLHGVRCDGRDHGGCEMGCQLLWKEDWLRRRSVRAGVPGAAPSPAIAAPAIAPQPAPDGEPRYRCQATELHRASTPLRRRDPRQFLRPLVAGNVSLLEFLRVVSIEAFNALQNLRGGAVYPHWPGSTQERTPTVSLGLQPGEWVRVRSKDEILRTLDKRNRNRGLWFDTEMLRYCGRRFRVLRIVSRLIEEKSGRLVHLKTPSVVLEGVSACGELYRFNPQNDYILWREIWLERVGGPAASG